MILKAQKKNCCDRLHVVADNQCYFEKSRGMRWKCPAAKERVALPLGITRSAHWGGSAWSAQGDRGELAAQSQEKHRDEQGAARRGSENREPRRG